MEDNKLKFTDAELKELKRQTEVLSQLENERRIYLNCVLRSHEVDAKKIWNVDLNTGEITEQGVLPVIPESKKEEAPQAQEEKQPEEPKKEESQAAIG